MGQGKRVVVETRDRKQMSLPAIKQDLERETKERDANVSLYVSSCADMLPQHVGGFQIYGEKVVPTLDNLLSETKWVDSNIPHQAREEAA
jgi:hypothetical protein